MKIINITATTLLIFAAVLLTSAKPPEDAKALKAFNRASAQLAALKKVKYHYSREFNYPAEDYVSKAEGDMYIEFGKENDVAGFRFQYFSAEGFSIFNNAEIFDGNIKDKKLKVTPKVKTEQLEGKSALFNSVITLRNILPIIIADNAIPKTIADTLINRKPYNLLQFVLHNKLVNYIGTGFTGTTIDITFVYKIITDKTTGLPVTVLQTKIGSKDLNRTDFAYLSAPPAVAEQSWYYSSYLNTYALTTKGAPVNLIATGQNAPEWSLTNFNGKAKEGLSQYSGNVVLMEFWIKNCGHCIEAVAPLNKLNDLYNKSRFKILAINTEDSEKAITTFITTHEVKFPVMYGDDPTVNKNYGVTAFPQVVLLDKKGVVIYSGNLDVEKLKPLIDKSLI
ncbi:peroxiredoxin [Mucilaginibacter sp. UYNi724]